MKLGISSFTYNWAVGVKGQAPWQPLETPLRPLETPWRPPETPWRPLTVFDLLDKAQALGVHVLQIGDNLPLDRLPAAELRDFSSRAKDMQISIEAGTRGLKQDLLAAYIDIARIVGSPILRTVIDKGDDRPSEEEATGRLKLIAPELSRAGVTLAVENHDRFPVSVLARIVERAGSPRIRVCLDTTNSFGAGEDPMRVVDVLAPLAVNVHLKDYAAVRMEHTMGMRIEGRPAGQGLLDIPWLIEELRRRAQDPNIILELWTGPEASLSESMAKEDRWARESVRYMRGIIGS